MTIADAKMIIWDRCQHCKETEEALKFLTDYAEKYKHNGEMLDIVLAERKNEVCGKCDCYDRQFSYCNKLGVTFADDDFCSCFEQKEVDE